ncbi:MAG: type II toxin-antitoxin system Phd/YefM family antitoxin [Gemmatimonadota bacterium]|nr:type II toxin-antitoxin system Phd/YefM family antitoxin [Gemmatimonadota bacterium]
MDVYTYSEARQHLSSLLDEAESTGKVIIRRKDGRRYAVVPELSPVSPLDMPTVETSITVKEMVKLVRRQRVRGKKRGSE